ncbi:hypothetical protein [Tenacibaculum retecalamus]|uniref:hypothetical protein n=1 Tax=Tenacibaculum retecalamus TaxID=3018315 RepID=UPI0023D964ED|nr:hypothetical protein [Tenacibaculum retecalamus]WBX70781.1 hypothetical protein PG912_11200 [Tenacibaculum retecalamus]
MTIIKKRNIVFVVIFLTSFCFSQQRAANIDVPKIKNPRFLKSTEPTIYIDQSHQNFHQKEGRFKPFADLLAADGYKVDSIINLKNLKIDDILIISNPIHQKNVRNWRQPIHSAFTKTEIAFIQNWVKKGGKLLLIADHMPFAGAANNLANAFGFNFCDGFAYLQKEKRNLPDVFSEDNERLVSSEITNGNLGKKINAVTTFTGSSFTIPKAAKEILKFKKNDYCLAPEVAWQFNDETPRHDLKDKYQGAILKYGKGKIAVFGEAAMFTAQTITNNSGIYKFGFHAKSAPNNVAFIRNLLFWFSKN